MKTTNNTIHMPVLGFGTLIPDAAETISATRGALEAGFRHFDCAERYRNESEVGWAVQRGTALLTSPKTAARARENFDISPLPVDAFDEINRIQTRQRFNPVVNTGVPGFIARG
jgi:diketogulonate reductase-like aldo/keto reductase